MNWCIVPLRVICGCHKPHCIHDFYGGLCIDRVGFKNAIVSRCPSSAPQSFGASAPGGHLLPAKGGEKGSAPSALGPDRFCSHRYEHRRDRSTSGLSLRTPDSLPPLTPTVSTLRRATGRGVTTRIRIVTISQSRPRPGNGRDAFGGGRAALCLGSPALTVPASSDCVFRSFPAL